MNQRYPLRMQYLDRGNSTNFSSPSSSSAPSAGPPGPGSSKSNAFSPAVVAVIGVLAGAFLIVSYYRIFLRYCNRHHFTFWGTRSHGRHGGPSTIVSSPSLFTSANCAPTCVAFIEQLGQCTFCTLSFGQRKPLM